MSDLWNQAPNAGTWKVALQSQLGITGCVRKETPLIELWKNLGRSNGVWADWAARFADYGSSRSPEDKARLPAINVSTICGSLDGETVQRRTRNVIKHTGLIVLDLDKAINARVLASEIARFESVMGEFVSPSGNGVKVIIPVNPIPRCVSDHSSAYSAVRDAIEDYISGCKAKFQYEIDESGKDPVRLMFAYSHTPFRAALNREAIPVQWKPNKVPPALTNVSQDPVELDEFLACLGILKLGKHENWLRARGASITQGLTFEEWDSIAAQNPGYEGPEKQLRQWEYDVRSGNRIPARTIFVLARNQGLKPADWRKLMVNPKPYISIRGGSQDTSSANGPESGGKRSRSKETGSSGQGDKASTYQCAKEFIKHCDESGRPSCYWPVGIWMFYGDHGWEQDPKAVVTRARLADWAEGPVGIAMQAPKSNAGRKGVLSDAETVRWYGNWDESEVTGLPNREVLVMNSEGLSEKESGNWRHYITKRTGAPIGSMDKEMSDLWTTCVEQWMEDDEVRFYVQVLLGAALLGRAVETRSVLYIQSASQFGKSTFLDAVLGAFGDYGLTAPPETFMRQFGSKHPTEVAGLKGARLIVASELPNNGFWNAARIKQLSGGEIVSARLVNKDFMQFRPQFLIVLSGNHDPKIAGGDSEGLKQRLRLVRWTKRGFKNPDRNLAKKLASASGKATVLQWLVQGAEHYSQDGLPNMPDIMRQDRDSYVENNDWVEAFKKTLEFGPEYWTPSRDLKKHYDQWAETEGIPGDHRKSSRVLKAAFLTFSGCRELRRKSGPSRKWTRGIRGVRPLGEDLSDLLSG